MAQLAASVVTAIAGAPLVDLVPEAAAIGVLGAVGRIGDLSESFLKRARAPGRRALIPGHGGVLDQLDSLLFNVRPCIVALLVWCTLRGMSQHLAAVTPPPGLRRD